MASKASGILRRLRWLFAALVVVLAGLLIGGFLALRGSLPALNGRQTLVGLGAEAAVERDANGVPTVHAASREDAARVLGYLHAQDRFFGMDLLRRQSAGELAELFGAAALPLDRDLRRHRFRARTAATLAVMDPASLRLLDAYVAGVNAGLASLQVRPFEYLVLHQVPRPWTREDTLLVVDSMFVSLQEHDGLDERTRLALREVYGPEAEAFLRPAMTEQTAALDGSAGPALAVPDAAHLTPKPGLAPVSEPAPTPKVAAWSLSAHDPDAMPGSNEFALAGPRVAGSSALVANDMHLDLSVPNIWYRASLALAGRTVTGVSLPGVPGIVVGSNGDIAWGYTDAYADTSDVVVVEPDPADPTRYRVPDGDGWERFRTERETIRVAGRAPETLEIVETRWGPLLTPVPRAGKSGRVLALHWIAYDPGVFNLHGLNEARSVDEAVTIAHEAGGPANNLVVGDRAGNIAWTIVGRVPRRVGFDGLLPESWADGSRRWDGFLPPDLVPVIKNPASGQLWTANNRVVGGEALSLLGNGGYDSPARAGQIRDDLTSLATRAAKPADGLAIQLDDEARFLGRWRELLTGVLTDAAIKSDPSLEELRRLVNAWHGHAAVDEAGYRLVRTFRLNVITAVLDPLYEPVRRYDPALEISHTNFADAEQPVWSLVTQRPAWVLPPGGPGWEALLRRAAHETAALGTTLPGHPGLSACTWGQRNTLKMQHPFSRGLPGFLARALDMPAQSLPGDSNMPRVQGVKFGASERMVVSPGREKEGIFHQPGGASGHPLSPFYRAGHDDWVRGRPSSFLPGAAKYKLVLAPGA